MDSAEPISGTITVIDADPGESGALSKRPMPPRTYGSITIMPSGAWEYTLDTTDPAIAALVQGESSDGTPLR